MSAPAVKLRAARPDDADAIGRYFHRCWIEGYAGLVDARVLAGLTPADALGVWQKRLADGVEVTVATVDDVPVGHLWIENGVIANIYVDPGHWGEGLGRRLLAEGERQLRTAGHRDGELWTIVGNARAVALYTSAGWALDGERATHVSSMGVPVEEVRLIKRL